MKKIKVYLDEENYNLYTSIHPLYRSFAINLALKLLAENDIYSKYIKNNKIVINEPDVLIIEEKKEDNSIMDKLSSFDD